MANMDGLGRDRFPLPGDGIRAAQQTIQQRASGRGSELPVSAPSGRGQCVGALRPRAAARDSKSSDSPLKAVHEGNPMAPWAGPRRPVNPCFPLAMRTRGLSRDRTVPNALSVDVRRDPCCFEGDLAKHSRRRDVHPAEVQASERGGRAGHRRRPRSVTH